MKDAQKRTTKQNMVSTSSCAPNVLSLPHLSYPQLLDFAKTFNKSRCHLPEIFVRSYVLKMFILLRFLSSMISVSPPGRWLLQPVHLYHLSCSRLLEIFQ